MQAVHHLTYERVERERLEDLLGVCNLCHEWLSGKTHVDPLKQDALARLEALFDKLREPLNDLYDRRGLGDDALWGSLSQCIVEAYDLTLDARARIGGPQRPRPEVPNDGTERTR